MTAVFLILAVLGALGAVPVIFLAGRWVWRRWRRQPDPSPATKEDVAEIKQTVDELRSQLSTYLDGLPQATPEVRGPFEEGRRLQQAEEHEAAIREFEKAFAAAENDRQRSALHILIGNSFSVLSRFPEAEGHYKQALTTARHITDSQAEAAALGNLGITSAERGAFADAKQCFEKALAIHEEIGNELGQANQLCNLGIFHGQKGDPDKAEECLKQALHIHQQIGNRLGQAKALGNLGNVYFKRAEPGDLDKAEEHYNKALVIDQEIGYRLGQAAAFIALANVYVVKDSPDKAQEYYMRALAIHQDIGHRLGEATTLLNLGVLHKFGKKPRQALRYLREARRILAEVGASAGVQKADELIAGLETASPPKPKRKHARRKPPPKP